MCSFFLIIGTINERTVKPTAEIDELRPLPEPTAFVDFCVGRSGSDASESVAGQTETVASAILTAGFVLPGLPEAIGHRKHIAGERDRQVSGQSRGGHGQSA